ncbi:hypothetical protein GCM10018953_17230 [Streptosporangium nondiastaticum]
MQRRQMVDAQHARAVQHGPHRERRDDESRPAGEGLPGGAGTRFARWTVVRAEPRTGARPGGRTLIPTEPRTRARPGGRTLIRTTFEAGSRPASRTASRAGRVVSGAWATGPPRKVDDHFFSVGAARSPARDASSHRKSWRPPADLTSQA